MLTEENRNMVRWRWSAPPALWSQPPHGLWKGKGQQAAGQGPAGQACWLNSELGLMLLMAGTHASLFYLVFVLNFLISRVGNGVTYF